MKTLGENPKEPLGIDPEKDKQKNSRWEKLQKEILLSVDRPVDPQRSNFRPLGIAVDWSVDRFSQPESKALCRSTETIDRAQPRARLLQSVDRSAHNARVC